MEAETPHYRDLLKWETIAKDTYRLRVPGGWLYRYQDYQTTPTMVFVPAVAGAVQRTL